MPTCSSWARGIALLAIGICLLPATAVADAPSETPPPVVTALPAFPDVDAMAARVVARKDLYAKVRDEALADYAKRNATPAAYDEKARVVIRDFSYLWTMGGDFYGEAQWQHGSAYANAVQAQGSKDPLVSAFLRIHGTAHYCSATEDDAEQFDQATDQFLAGEEPAALKLWVCGATLDNLVNYRATQNAADGMPSMQARAHYVQEWGRNYRELIKQGVPHDKLYQEADAELQMLHLDEGTLDFMIAELERDFNETDPKNPVRLEVDADYYLKKAWNQRSPENDGPVPPAAQTLLEKADKILNDTYARYPNELGTCREMMSVVLGLGRPRDQLETWFQRAIKIDPDGFDTYRSKERFLLPKWYGSVDDIVAYGQECVRTDNWPALVPTIYVNGISAAAERDPTLYLRPEIWNEVEKVYRDCLTHYPHSVSFRTLFAKKAYESGHKDIAKEQMRILGAEWDHEILTDEEFAKMVAEFPSG